MPRLLTPQRRLVVGRRSLAGPRRPVPTLPRNGKLNVVIDTNVWVKYLKRKQEGRDAGLRPILEEIINDGFNLVVNHRLFQEYDRVFQEQRAKGNLTGEGMSELMHVIIEKRVVGGRFSVDDPVPTHNGKDNHLYNSNLEADYLVTLDGPVKKTKQNTGNLKAVSVRDLYIALRNNKISQQTNNLESK